MLPKAKEAKKARSLFAGLFGEAEQAESSSEEKPPTQAESPPVSSIEGTRDITGSDNIDPAQLSVFREAGPRSTKTRSQPEESQKHASPEHGDAATTPDDLDPLTPTSTESQSKRTGPHRDSELLPDLNVSRILPQVHR